MIKYELIYKRISNNYRLNKIAEVDGNGTKYTLTRNKDVE
jgi:hypothetical protein